MFHDKAPVAHAIGAPCLPATRGARAVEPAPPRVTDAARR